MDRYKSCFYTYIICNSADEVYVGITKNLRKRLAQHRKGKSKATCRRNLNWKLLHYYTHESYLMCAKLEKFLHDLQLEDTCAPLDFADAYPFYSPEVGKLVAGIEVGSHEMQLHLKHLWG